MTRRIVAALGGNALLSPDHGDTLREQFQNANLAMLRLVDLIEQGHELVITHGNGPQVGHVMMRVEAAQGIAYDVPLSVAVAETQGETGYLLSQCLSNCLLARGIQRNVVALVTQVEVAPDDPALTHPTKPVGRFYTQAEARELTKQGKCMIEDSGRGWRQVVPSPRPRKVLEAATIRDLVARGTIVIAGGGGGIPVYRKPDGSWVALDGVVDKDRTSAVLAREIMAQDLLILTGVDCIWIDYATPGARPLRRIDVAEARRHLADGQFPPGSMGPKMEAAIEFVEGGGERAIVASLDNAGQALAGEAGTTIVATAAGAPL